jgi:aminopeptidase N
VIWLPASLQIHAEETKLSVHDPLTKFRKDYQPTPYLIDTVYLDFILNDDVTHVHSQLRMTPNYKQGSPPPPLVLDGRKDVSLVSIKVNGAEVAASNYERTEKTLTVNGLPSGEFELAITTTIKPQENTLLEGLYKSGGNFSTQVQRHVASPQWVVTGV